MTTVGKQTKRRHPRHPVSFPIELRYQSANGLFHRLMAKARNLSRSGMQVELRCSIPVGAYVMLESKNPPLHGTASVRYCQAKGLCWLAGLEFSGGLTWDPPSEPCAEDPGAAHA